MKYFASKRFAMDLLWLAVLILPLVIMDLWEFIHFASMPWFRFH